MFIGGPDVRNNHASNSNSNHGCNSCQNGTIMISTATVLVCFGYVQRVDVGMHISLMVIGLKTAVGYEDTAAATARYSLPACNHQDTAGDSSV